MADLVTTARAKLNPQLAGADATLLAALISAASTAVERYCKREFASVERTEYYDGDGGNALLLDAFPVTEIDSLSWLDADDVVTALTGGYRLNGVTGEVCLKTEWFPAGVQNIKVVYTAGFTTIPAPLQEAVVQIVARLYADGQRDQTASSEKLGDYAVSYLTDEKATWSSTIRALLGPYKDYRV